MTKEKILKLLLVPLISANIFTVISLLSAYNHYADLVCNFAFQFLTVQIVCLLFLSFKYKKIALISALIMLLNLYQIIPFYIPVKNDISLKQNEDSIKLLQLNVLVSNKEYEKVRNLIKKYDPDILMLNEINRNWVEALSNSLSDFKYQIELPRNDYFGMAVYSKFECDLEERYFESSETPYIIANVQDNDKRFTLIFTHLCSPQNLKLFEYRATQLDELTKLSLKNRFILAGDFNLTNYSSYYRNFLKTTKLVDSRKGFGLQHSWPTFTPIFRLSLDHYFVSKDIKVIDRKVLESVGSDHFPVLIKLN